MKREITPSDPFVRYFLAHPENSRDLLRNAIPDRLLQHFDLDDIEVSQETFVDEELTSRHSDILIQTRLKGSPAFVYVLVEHKSSPYKWTLLQLLKYMVRIWEREIDRSAKLKKLPVIIPFILYHGLRQWRLPLNFTDYFQDSDLLQEYIPDFSSVLYDLNQVDDEKIKGHLIYVAAIKALKYALRGLKPHLEEILKELGTLPIDEQMRAFLSSFFKYILSAGRGVRSEDLGRAIDSAGFKESREVYMTIAEELKLEAEIANDQQILIRLLDKKFGLNSAARDKILKADNKKKLDRAIDLLLDAKTIDEVLKPLD